MFKQTKLCNCMCTASDSIVYCILHNCVVGLSIQNKKYNVFFTRKLSFTIELINF